MMWKAALMKTEAVSDASSMRIKLQLMGNVAAARLVDLLMCYYPSHPFSL